MTAEIQRYVDYRRKRVSARTVINDCLVISRFCKWLMQRRQTHGISWRVCPASRSLIDVPRAATPQKQAIPADTVVGYHPDTITHHVRRIRDKAGLPPVVTLQGLRKTFVTRLYHGGINPQISAKLAGHTVQTAMRYYADLSSIEVTDALKCLDFSSKTAPKTAPKRSTVKRHSSCK